MAQQAVRYQDHRRQIQAWKKALAEGAALIARLYKEIGQLKVERNFFAEMSCPRVQQGGGRWWAGSIRPCPWCASASCWR